MSKYSKGDVVRLNSPVFRNWNGELGVVVQIETNPYEYLVVRTEDGKKLAVQEYLVIDVTLEEVRQYYAVRPRRGFIVDGLMVDELEAGQEEAYEVFRTAAKEASEKEELQAAEEELKHRGVLSELTATAILWVVFTVLSLAMWTVMVWQNDGVIPWIGLLSAWAGTVTVVKPMVALIAVCRRQIDAHRKRKEDP